MNKKKVEDTKEIIRIRLTKNRQHNGKKKKYKRTNNDRQNITQKTKDRVTRTQLKRTNNDLQNTTQTTKHRVTRTQLKRGRVNLGAPEW